jgi:hypothetical protein
MADQRRATSADARLLGYRITINNGILRKLCEKFGCSYNARSKTRVAGVWGATEQGKQLSVVTDACKEIWVVGANRYRNPDEDLPADFEIRRGAYYEALRLPQDAKSFTSGVQNGSF